MIEIILSVLLGLSVIINIVAVPAAINGIKIIQEISQIQTTINNVENINDNRNINTVTVGAGGVSVTNSVVITEKSSITNTTINKESKTNLLIN